MDFVTLICAVYCWMGNMIHVSDDVAKQIVTLNINNKIIFNLYSAEYKCL